MTMKTKTAPQKRPLITAKMAAFGCTEVRWHRHPNGDWVSNHGEIKSSEEMNKRPLIVPTTKAGIAKHNAHQFFQNLILSLTKNKRKWTATERMQYNRVAKFLET